MNERSFEYLQKEKSYKNFCFFFGGLGERDRQKLRRGEGV